MKKYILICFDGYYPVGGFFDIQAMSDSLEKLKEKVNIYAGDFDHKMIYDRDTLEIVWENSECSDNTHLNIPIV